MIVIPMVGMSSRFFNAGYNKPKYMLEIDGKSVFSLAVESFKSYFESDSFLFVVRSDFDAAKFVRCEAERLGLLDFDVVVIDGSTRGQAETVALGLQAMSDISDEELIIFNIDTFRPGYKKPDFASDVCGYLETFIGSGSNWSNVEPADLGSNVVKRTAEKQSISEFCCTGLYFWRSADCYLRIYDEYAKSDARELDGGELYVAPMYNICIRDGGDIRFTVIDESEVIFCGTPDEYERLLLK
ncbi:capsular biosynthesis protein [Halopseudomonas aestusnigri]|jgi:hypothetical protein|uniref:capsular biosynthesis protein n=1 Tax=Halopseudomonas aestusnigri TaxID=857252 RepID=UPI003003999C